MQVRHIAVATDESEPGRSAVQAGFDLAARSSARLTIMRVAQPARPTDAERIELERLEQWVAPELTPRAGVQVELDITSGVPAIEICRYAEACKADLLVLGRKHRSAVTRLLVGDTSDAVIRRSRVPCLFVEQGQGPFGRVLVALDGSERGMAVFRAARGFANAIGADVGVVTVEQCEVSPAEPSVPLTTSARLQRVLEPVIAGAASGWGGAAITVRRGHIVREVVAELAESEADLLAFGCHRGGPSGILPAGGTARRLARSAPVSVLTIPL